VTFGYRTKKPVLTDFNFTAEPGKVTALVGPSGSGKSTIINLIERFYDVQAGEVLIDGQDIAKVRLASLRNNIALVSQDTVIFRGTVRENIRFGRPSATDAEVEEAARNAMAHDFIEHMPEGYDTELEAGGGQMSGGQRQRIAIARAMLRDAPIILLDEATSALDAESEHQVQIAFDRLMVGRTTIVIAHRLSTILGADRICVVVGGQVVESGRHAELLVTGKHYARIYHLQFERHVEPKADGPGDEGLGVFVDGPGVSVEPEGTAFVRAGRNG
jgi:subfamily B ATP-binding cassette protein MsbA